MTKRRTIHRLTAKQVIGARKPGLYCDGGGLYLQIGRPSGTKSWIFRYAVNGRTHDHGLGPIALVSLPEARDRAIAARKLLLDNIDPITAKRAAKRAAQLEMAKSLTFSEAAKQYIAAQKPAWKNAKHSDQWLMTLLAVDINGKPTRNDYCKAIRNLPVGVIETSDIVKVLMPIWNSKTETATRIRARIESVMDWCEAHGYREGKNPARWKGNLDHILPERGKVQKIEHQPALPYREVPALVQELRQREAIAARALEFLILTAVRPGNVVNARWSQIDRGVATWTIPASEMKSDAPHTVPLSKPALAVLDQMAGEQDGEFIFGQFSNAALAAVIKRLNTKARRWIDPTTDREVVPHGFRSSFRDWAAETGVADAIAESVLAHKVADQVIAAYRRTKFDEARCKVMADWGAYVERAPVDGKVVPLLQRA
jgi:integrase